MPVHECELAPSLFGARAVTFSRIVARGWMGALLAASGPAHAVDTRGVLEAMREFAEFAVPAVAAISMVAGFILMVSTLVKLGQVSRGAGSNPLAHPDGGVKAGAFLGRLAVSALMLSLGWSLTTTIETFFGAPVSVRAALAYAPIQQMGNDYWKLVWNVIIVWIILIGVSGFFRGLLLLHDSASGSQQQSGGDLIWRAFWHLIGGAVAVNIGMFFV